MAYQTANGVGGDKQSLSLNQWLDTNRLNRLKPYFQTEEVIMEDLLAFTTHDLQLSTTCEF